MRGLSRLVAAGALALLASGRGVRLPWSEPETSGPCPHEVLGVAEAMASVKVGVDDAPVAFGDGAEFRVCPYGFTGLTLVLEPPPGVTATPRDAEVVADGEPLTFRVVAEPGASGRVTWKVGSAAKGLEATGSGPTVVTTDDGWHLEPPDP